MNLIGNGLTLIMNFLKKRVDEVSSSTTSSLANKADLDSNGKVPSSQLPSYVDDVLEYNNLAAFPATGETGKIYVAKDTNKTYRWSGSEYVEISQSLALGETSGAAYRGDRGAAAYTHAVTNKGVAYASGLYKITTNSEGHVTAGVTVTKSDITSLGVADATDTVLSGSLSLGRKSNTTIGQYSSAIGSNVEASALYSHAEGSSTTASDEGCHAEGKNSSATGNSCHAEGNYTTASGNNSHSEGDHSTASGICSHAEGSYAESQGYYSHAEGRKTIATRRSQHVAGEYNLEDTSGTTSTRGNYVEIIGNGTSSTRSNARTLDWSGNEWVAGNITAAGGSLTLGNVTITDTQLQALIALAGATNASGNSF